MADEYNLSRHPNRPYTLDYIKAICGDTFMELHGDRSVKDDKAMIGGLGKIGDQSFMFIGQQKGIIPKLVSIVTSVWLTQKVTVKHYV